MQRGHRKHLAVGTMVLGLGACSVSEPTVRSSATARAVGPIAGRIAASVPQARAADEPSPARVPRAKARSDAADPGPPRDALDVRTACNAWSTDRQGPLDARDSADLATCRFSSTGEESVARLCGRGEVRKPFELARLDEAVLAFDDATRAHVSELAARGRAAGRNARSFGLVGDSITVGSYFLGPFGEGSPKSFSLAPEVALALRTSGEAEPATIVDWFRGAKIVRELGTWRDSFRATRAAKVGARSSWALVGDPDSPLGSMVDRLSPAVAIVMYGSNDAAWRIAPPEELAHGFEEDLGRLVDALERRGVVPVLSTIPRHGRQPGLRACDRFADDVSNWRLVVQTNAVNVSIAKVACERHIPLVDLRHAFDGLVNHGLGKDGIHPTSYLGGAGELTPDGLQCGYNVRNYVTLLMLARLQELVGPSPQ